MDISKSSIRGLVGLVVLVVVLLGFRAHYLAERDECRNRLLHLVPVLAAYARTHHGLLPATSDELARALGGPLPTSTIVSSPDRAGLARLSNIWNHSTLLPYSMAAHPLIWKSGKPQPYLWDPCPHNYVSGVHVLYSDGRVTTEDAVPR